MKRSIILFLLVAATDAVAVPERQDSEETIRRKIRETLFVPDPLPPLKPEKHGRFEPEPGVVAERVTYGTQFGLRVPAILYRPAKASVKGPGLIVVNGHGGDKFSWYAYYTGILYARAGAIVLTYDPTGEGERNAGRKSGTRAHDRIKGPPELGRRQGGLMVTDVMQAVSYLSSRPEVDPKRIGAMGYSMGTMVLAITGAVEIRLRACILAGGGNIDGPDEYWDNSKPMCQAYPYRSLRFLGDRPARIYALHASRGPTLIYNGSADEVVGIQPGVRRWFERLRDRTVRLRGSEEGVFDVIFEPGAGHRPYFVTMQAALWLERKLDFPNWRTGRIGAMPEVHISEWARENGAKMEKYYASEHREGGTRALGPSVPVLPRDSLHVFPADEWERRKPGMILESWLEKVRPLLPSDR